MTTTGVRWAELRSALLPQPGGWGVLPGSCAAAAAAVVLYVAIGIGDIEVGAIAYLGVACAVSFVGTGGPRSRVARLAGQAAGAAVGMTVGALVPATAGWVVAAAVAVGFLAGAIGRIGPASTAAAVTAVIGVAYTQFDRLVMPWWEPVLAYVTGSTVLLVLTLVTMRPGSARRAVAAVLDAAADLIPGPPDDASRHRLAAAWATAREAAVGYRLRPPTGGIADAWEEARSAADRAAHLEAARLERDGETDTGDTDGLGRSWRATATELRIGLPRPSSHRTRPTSWSLLRTTLRPATEPAALWTGARVAACAGVATALAIAIRTPAHAFWIPLTVAVLVRPEYGSVLVRSLHRLVGTLLGVSMASVLLALTSSPTGVAAGAALSLGLAAFGATRLYGLAVVGITGSALLGAALSSSALGNPAGFEPWARLLDTALGCAVALVVGVLLWPHRGLPDPARTFGEVAAALADYAENPGPRTADEAYRRAHDWHAQLLRDLTEPDPTRTAASWLPVAHRLEHLVDRVTGPSDTDPLRATARTPAEASDRLADFNDQLRRTG